MILYKDSYSFIFWELSWRYWSFMFGNFGSWQWLY